MILNVSDDDLEWLYIPDVVYAEYGDCKRHLQLIVPYQPEWRFEKFPLIVFVPGSAWYKQDLYAKIPVLGRLARLGYAIAEVEYRESTIAPFPAQIQDAKAAIKFMKSKAKEYHIDAENVFIFGDSSGGHTALLAGLTKDLPEFDTALYPEYSSDVKGIIDYFGPTNLLLAREEEDYHGIPHYEKGPLDDLFGVDNILNIPDIASKASCEHYINKQAIIPPILIVHGTADDTVYISQSQLLYNQLKGNGKEASMYTVLDAGHGGARYWCEDVLSIIDEFIRRILSEK